MRSSMFGRSRHIQRGVATVQVRDMRKAAGRRNCHFIGQLLSAFCAQPFFVFLFLAAAAEVENVGHVWVADDGVQFLREVCCARGVVKPKRDES